MAVRMLGAVCVAALAALAGAAASASADQSPEGVWSFNGGSVAIQPQADGSFVGTVLTATKFAECAHEPGERMWTDMTEQPDGSYWGFHRWFFAGSDCLPNPALGPTAWRVMTAGSSRYLKVCLSEPDRSQPTIPAAGEPTGYTFGCVDSALVSALPTATAEEFLSADFLAGESGGDGSKGAAGVAAAVCIPRNKLRIRISNPRTNPLRRVVIVLRGGGVRKVFKVKPRPGRSVAVVSLRKLPAVTVRATVRLTTILGAHMHRRHTYRRC